MFGPITEGTTRNTELLCALYRELDRRVACEFVRELRDYLAETDFDAINEDENANELIGGALELLNDQFAAPFTYWGFHPVDGASLGSWPDIDALDDAIRCNVVMRISDLSEITEEHHNEDVALVNDHGNVTFGHVNGEGEFLEQWSVV